MNIKNISNKLTWIKTKSADTIFLFILAFLSTSQVGYLLSTASFYGAAWGITLAGFYAANIALLLGFRKFVILHKDGMFKRRTIWACILSIIVGITYVFGYQLQYVGYSAPGFTGKFSILLRAIALLPLFYPLFYMLLYGIDHIHKVEITGKAYVDPKSGKVYSIKKIYFISFFVIFLSWIPAFFAYYPIIMSYDFHAQVIYSALGFQAFGKHHPYLSTLEIYTFYKLGLAMGNTQLGMAFMAVFHMLVNSATYAYAVVVASKLLPKKETPYIAAFVLGFFPTNPVMILSTTKDVLFSLFFMLFILLIIERCLFADTRRKKILFNILIVFVGINVSLWRNNMIYAVLASGIILSIFIQKKYKLLILVGTILIFVGYKFSFSMIGNALGDKSGTSKNEMFSIIVQAYGRTVTRNLDSLDPEVSRRISFYLDERCWNEYNPSISDPLKSNVLIYDTYPRFIENMGDTIKDFLYVCSKYPNECLDSFLDTTRGYWFIDDTSYADVLGDGYEGRMGIIYTYNSSASDFVDEIKHESKLPAVEWFYESIVSENVVLRMPLINCLFKISVYTMGTFLIAVLYIYKKDYKALKLITTSVMYILTMFLGPVVQFRYAYPWIITFGFFVILLFTDTSISKKNDNSPINEPA